VGRGERKRDRKYREKNADKPRLSEGEELPGTNVGEHLHQVQVQQEHPMHLVQVQQEHHLDICSNNSEEVEHFEYDSDFRRLD
jgi:hypothetical protein